MCFGQRPVSDAFRRSFVNEMSQLVDFRFSRLSDGSISQQGSRPISMIISIAYLYRLEHFPSYHSYQRPFLPTFLNCQTVFTFRLNYLFIPSNAHGPPDYSAGKLQSPSTCRHDFEK